jgi:hypothetical protein
MSSTLVAYESHYVERRSRLSTFFRWLLVIPHFIAWYFYGLAAGIVVIVAWFAIVITGRYPQGMYDFVAGFLRFQTRMFGYVHLLTDEYPPFSGSPERHYPVDLRIGPPLESYSRWKTALRLLLAIPVYIIVYAMQIVAGVGAFIAWFAIVVLGRQPSGLQEMTNVGLSYYMRAYAYFCLITEDWPAFADGDALEPGPGPPQQFAPPQAPPAVEPPPAP